jgi:gamma-glutamylcyclotransferase (GGCT)/AIG2-like uncharacterized protein YtfP
MSSEIMDAVTGFQLSAADAVLRGFRRNRLRGELYPAITASSDAMVEGVVYDNVPEEAWERLDQFEGDIYSRRVVTVEMEDGSFRPAQTYVLRPEFEGRLSEESWSLREFLRSGKARFESHYRGFAALSSATPTQREE